MTNLVWVCRCLIFPIPDETLGWRIGWRTGNRGIAIRIHLICNKRHTADRLIKLAHSARHADLRHQITGEGTKFLLQTLVERDFPPCQFKEKPEYELTCHVLFTHRLPHWKPAEKVEAAANINELWQTGGIPDVGQSFRLRARQMFRYFRDWGTSVKPAASDWANFKMDYKFQIYNYLPHS